MTEQTPMTQEQLDAIRERLDCGTPTTEDVSNLLAEVERLRALTTVDDAMVERAARELYLRESDWSSEAKWDRIPEFARESWRKTARAALDAALGTGVES